ncbi:FAD binding domain-containing protein [Leptolyngbya sp. FACHB-36]|uniref:FAD binding domain-containing protein n=1 Tax=Leptolyngbya sp. FACHB-36 TaxID=2692808 RepID=UPI001681135B|nr:FAD binding domain-containing protein [Leptolyngbya sp. FACHB-36]MBD2019474.1 FAD binding domain-containing protein [Leptolyngbya sp. FACHB-36]
MDLHTVETYCRPLDLASVPPWKRGCAWLAGGTWIFSEPQPHLTTLVDLEPLGWSEITVEDDRLEIGATCTLRQLVTYPWSAEWTATEAFRGAVSALAASFKVTHLATIGGNVCLALAIGVMAPVLVALDATYEIWSPTDPPRTVAAKDFQLGVQQTVLQPGEVLRRIWIPLASLSWRTQVQRFGIAETDPALSLVVAAVDPATDRTRVCLGACVVAPYLLEFDRIPSSEQITAALQAVPWLTDSRASGSYRQQMTEVLIRRSLHALREP